jgi:hypothetical protein
MEALLNNTTVDYSNDLKEIIKHFTDDTNRQFAEIMKNVNILHDLYKNGMGSKIQKLELKILINSIYKNNELGKKITYDEYGKLIPRYRFGTTDDIIIRHYENDGWKYPFWKALSNKIMSRQIANIKNSYLDIYQKLPYTMKILFNLGWHERAYFDDHREGKIQGSQGMCHYFVLGIELDFTENIFKPKPEQVKPVKTGWFSSKPKEPERPNFGYSQIATDEEIYIEMKKLL